MNANSIAELLKTIPETRRQSGNFKHPIREILVLVMLGLILGGKIATVRGIVVWAKKNLDTLRSHGLEYAHGVPSHQTISRVLRKIDPVQLKAIEKLWRKSNVELLGGDVVAIDGKALVHAEKADGNTPYIVSAWANKSAVVMGEVKTLEKSNEIAAIPELLDSLSGDLCGKVVTIDAAGCQKNIAQKIIGYGADYVLALKANQPNMLDDFAEYFEKCRATHANTFKTHCTAEKNHGRFEKRDCIQTDYVSWFAEHHKWDGLKSVIRIDSERIAAGSGTKETRYYISSLPLNPKHALKCVRSHWGVENSLHWCIDVHFGEDKCLTRKDNAPENLSILRHVAMMAMKHKGLSKNISLHQMCVECISCRESLYEVVFA